MLITVNSRLLSSSLCCQGRVLHPYTETSLDVSQATRRQYRESHPGLMTPCYNMEYFELQDQFPLFPGTARNGPQRP